MANVLIIAGSDSGGGAGVQADLKTCAALGAYAATAITAITAQNTMGVQRAEMLSPDLVAAQIASVLDDIKIQAVKIGMLGDAGIVAAVARALACYAGPVVLDPVMVAKSGDALLSEAAIAALRRDLLPRATVLTPNLPEAARLLGCAAARGADEIAAQGQALLALGPGAVLMKGGHDAGAVCTDILVTAQGAARFTAPRIGTRNTHGTGCTLSSAIAAGLAQGLAIEAAAGRAHRWLQGAIMAADRVAVGRGQGPVHHFHGIWA